MIDKSDRPESPETGQNPHRNLDYDKGSDSDQGGNDGLILNKWCCDNLDSHLKILLYFSNILYYKKFHTYQRCKSEMKR